MKKAAKKENVKQSWGPFLRVIWKYSPWLLMILAVASNSYTIFFSVILPELQGRIMGGEIFDMGLIWKYIGLNFLSMVLLFASQYLNFLATYRMTYNMQTSLWNRLVDLPMSVYNRTTPTSLVSRVTNDTIWLPSTVYEVLNTVVTVATVVNEFRALYLLHPKIALSQLIVVPYIILLAILPGRVNFKLNHNVQSTLSDFTGYVTERLTNLRLVKAAGSQQREDALGEAVLRANYKSKVRRDVIEGMVISPLISTRDSVMVAVGLLVTAGLTASGEVDAAAIPMVYFLVYMLALSLFRPMNLYMDLKRAQGYTAEVANLLETKPEQVKREQTFTMDDADIVFDDVSFRYGDKDVLSHVSFTIPSGKTTAIVGPSGAGKTTILSLLERLYTPTGGAIRFGDTPVEKIHLDDWRRAMGYIQQESPLVSGTIRENIGFGLDSEPTLEGVKEAASLANADDFIEALPEGYDTDIGQMGGKLSGGERQRIALARMIITKPNYLLLDEATASLDAENSAAVQKALRQVSMGRTTVIVAHDINTVRHADNIIVMDQGKVQAAGPHEKVYQESEIYHRYCDLLAKNLIEV